MLVKHKLQKLHKLVYQDQGVICDYDYEHFADKDVTMTWEIFQYYQQHATVDELKWEESSCNTMRHIHIQQYILF